MREDICQVYLWYYGEEDGPYEWRLMSKIVDEDIIKVLWESAIYRMLPDVIDNDGSESHRYLSETPEGTTERRLLKCYYLNKISKCSFPAGKQEYYTDRLQK